MAQYAQSAVLRSRAVWVWVGVLHRQLEPYHWAAKGTPMCVSTSIEFGAVAVFTRYGAAACRLVGGKKAETEEASARTKV